MEAYGPWIDAEGMCGIRLCLLLKHHLARYDQAFMSTPAHAQSEELEVIGEGADIHALAEYEREQARRAPEPGRQAVGQPRMADLFDLRMGRTPRVRTETRVEHFMNNYREKPHAY